MYTLFTKCLFEFIGTLVLVLMGDGVCAATTLNHSKAKGAGWVVIAMAWGFAVMCGVFIAGPVSGAHLNPVVTLGLAVAGSFEWSYVLWYVLAQMLGGFSGAVLVWAFYKDHYDATEDTAAILGTFCTAPAIPGHKMRNVFCEALATFVLVFLILLLGYEFNSAIIETGPSGEHVHVGLGSMGAFPVTCVIMAIGMSLGGTTGYSLNPARDLSPRFAHFVLPFRHKGGSDWGYSWVPVVGPALGAVLAAVVYRMIFC